MTIHMRRSDDLDNIVLIVNLKEIENDKRSLGKFGGSTINKHLVIYSGEKVVSKISVIHLEYIR